MLELDDDDPFADTAKTDSCGARLLLRHFGQEGFSFPITSTSKRWLHSLQEYSKIGMVYSGENEYSTGYTTDLEISTVVTRFHQPRGTAKF
jgi:hypothetical protein